MTADTAPANEALAEDEAGAEAKLGDGRVSDLDSYVAAMAFLVAASRPISRVRVLYVLPSGKSSSQFSALWPVKNLRHFLHPLNSLSSFCSAGVSGGQGVRQPVLGTEDED